MTGYRQDIDGLRALAVIAVIANHTGWLPWPSGFLGVDIFFVISGYVIAGSLIVRPGDSLGSVLVRFYTRRIKRLLPALIVCVLVCGSLISVLDRMPSASLHTGATALLGAANLYLYTQALDYFATASSLNAFTHTWSLGIEEQFYFVLPVIFWAFFHRQSQRYRERTFGFIGFLTLGSLGLFLVLQPSQPIASFYLLHTRFWELGAGVLLAIWQARRASAARTESKPVQRWFGRQSLLLIALAGVTLCANTDPRLLMPAVVLLTLFAIAAPDRSPLIQNRGMVGIGLLSYSLYLWHWPLLVFARLQPQAMWTHPALLLALLVIAALLSWRFVERPLRYRAWSPAQRFDLPIGLATGTLAIGLMGALSLAVSKQILSVGDPLAPESAFVPLPSGKPYNPTCVVDDRQRLLQPDTFEQCTFPPRPGSQRPTLWAIGDSHAGHLQGLLVHLHDTDGFGMHLIGTPGRGFPLRPEDDSTSRLILMEDLYARIRPGDVMILGRLYLSRSDPPTVLDHIDQHWSDALDTLVAEMADRQVTVVIAGPPPMYHFSDIRLCNRERPESCGVIRGTLEPLVREVENRVLSLSRRHPNLKLLPVFDSLCPADQTLCTPVMEGRFTMRDRDHLNVHGARLLAPSLLELIAPVPE